MKEKGSEDEVRSLTSLSDKDLSDIETALRRIGPPAAPELSSPKKPDCPDEDLIWKFLSRRMKRKQQRLFLEHINQCDACCSLLAEVVRQPADPARQDDGRLLTQPPSIDPFVQKIREKANISTSHRLRTRSKTPWSWGYGAATLAAATVCICIVVFLGRPNIDMVVHLNKGHVVRSNGAEPLKPGAVLESGDQFRAEITARKDGFIYVYLLTEFQRGEFLFPSPSIPQKNRVSKGEHLFVPEQGLWIVDDKRGEEEILYLLFSETPARLDEISRILGELEKSEKTRSKVEKVFSRHFSIEEKIPYRHE